MIGIIPFTKENKEHIKLLNYEWLQKYFKVEPNDVVQLSDPQKEIIDKAGLIFYAVYNNEIVGTYSLIKINEEDYELAKMAVSEKYQGLGIGSTMMKHSMAEAAKLKAKIVTLYSNTKLEAAIHLYRKFGFKEVPLPADIHYERANIKMENCLNINPRHFNSKIIY